MTIESIETWFWVIKGKPQEVGPGNNIPLEDFELWGVGLRTINTDPPEHISISLTFEDDNPIVWHLKRSQINAHWFGPLIASRSILDKIRGHKKEYYWIETS